MDLPQPNSVLPLANLATSHVDQVSSAIPVPENSDLLVPEDLLLSTASSNPAKDSTPFSTPAEAEVEEFRTLKSETPPVESVNSEPILPASASSHISQSPESPLIAPSYPQDELEGPGSEDGRLSSENGVHLGHGSEEGSDAVIIMNGKKIDAGRRRSGTGLDMPVVEEPVLEVSKFSDGKAQATEEIEAEDSLEPLAARASPVQAFPALPPVSTLEPTNRISNPRAHTRTQSLASPNSVGSRSTAIDPARRPSSSASPNVESDSTRRRPSTSAEPDRSPRNERVRKEESEERKKEREKEKDSTRSRRVLGEWTMSKTLGAGSMGKVKLGISSITGEKVAIKIIPRFTSTAAAHRPRPPTASTAKDSAASEATNGIAERSRKDGREKDGLPPSPSYLAKAAVKDASKEVRTMREASMCLLLHHPYVCGMKSMVLYPHHYYMVFEYVNGGQMLDYIISHGRLRERSARKFARQIGSALQYCHANSIVHRDLKIENILISKTGNIKIIDFGLSNLYSPNSHLNTFCGSLYFAAPELLNAKPYTGPEVDVWSFGIVLYVLVCGKVPFDDQSMPALHAKIKRGQVEYPAWLSAECKHLLSRMLVTSPTQRATLTEVLAHPWIVKGFSSPPTDHVPLRTPLKFEEIDPEIIKGMLGFEFGTERDIHEQMSRVLDCEVYRTTVRNWEVRKNSVIDTEFDERATERPSTRVDGKDMKGGVSRSPTNKRFSGLGFYGKKIAGGFNALTGSSNGSKSGDDLSEMSADRVNFKAGIKSELVDPTRGFHPLISIYFLVQEKIEREKIWGPGVFASSTLSLNGPPPPPAPAMAYQSGSGFASPLLDDKPLTTLAAAAAAAAIVAQGPPLPLEPAIASPRMTMTPQPRQRATGDEFPQHPATAPLARRDGDYRSNKRSSFHPASTTPSPAPFRPSASYEPLSLSPTPAGGRNVSLAAPTEEDSSLDDIPLTTSSSFARRFGSLLGRSTSPSESVDGKRHRHRASVAGSAHKAGNKTAGTSLPPFVEESSKPFPTTSDNVIASPLDGKSVKRASTVGELSPSRHQRGTSMGAESALAQGLSRNGGSILLNRREFSSGVPRPQTAGALFNSTGPADSPVEEMQQQQLGFLGRTASSTGASEGAKPVYLKGLFSVATTSTKSISVIRADLVRVFDRLGVQHRDVKSGFECYHAPSIDLSTIHKSSEKETSTGMGTIRKRASKLLLASGQKELPRAPLSSQTSINNHDRTGTTSSSSFTVMPNPIPSSTEDDSTAQGAVVDLPSTTGEGSSVSRFEVFIVKMPFLPGIHGLQFRRIGGDAWQYQMLARRVLQELKL